MLSFSCLFLYVEEIASANAVNCSPDVSNQCTIHKVDCCVLFWFFCCAVSCFPLQYFIIKCVSVLLYLLGVTWIYQIHEPSF